MTTFAQRRGTANHHAGHAAECVAEERYRAGGYAVLERRWRGTGGEIDLICGDAEGLVFVEVKKARSFDAAAQRLTERQARRIRSAALEYLAERDEPMDRAMRFDLACVDQLGRCAMIENALMA